MELVRLKNVWKIYSEERVQTIALRGISFSIREGENIAIIGPSGSGKSTLLHLIGCLDTPTKGNIYFEGKDVSNLSDSELSKIRREKIGFVFQFFHLIPTMTALENVMLPMIFLGVPKEERRRRALRLLKIVGLEKRANHLPSELSGGERQRVAIARAMANNPKLILADEPTGNLDSKSGREIVKILFGLNKKGVTLIIVTHDLEIAKKAKRKIYLKDGKIIKEVGG
ncbi:MAG TPA: ABC transporter ATP-binding protein [Candidatus Aenigmarchaeota archaeon]|nr:ABC transporter ATP-binding protein [Candidatus Aenigmarchaeota archaeon]